MTTNSKKILYNSEFKLKICEYYMRNGGDSKYGLKAKTCALFNVNKKTINRLLENPEIVKRAKKNIGRNVKTGTKGTAGKVVKPGAKTMGKPLVKTSKVVVGKPSSSVNSKVSSSNVSSSQGTAGSNKQKVSGVAKGSGLGSSSSNNNTTTATTDKTSKQTNFSPQKDDAGKENATLFDILPENPDFSILKRPITSSSSSNASSIARLLVTGTNEVQNMLLNECEIIFECKVCRNLFRSIVNFLAHKRIYCRDNYTEVKNIFHKDAQFGLTTQSSTVVVEPEPPPESAAHKETWATSDNFSWRSRNRRRRIDNIADTLARKNDKKVETSPTSASDKGSSHYHQRIGSISSERDLVTKECSVTLENIAGVSNAVYQTYTPPDSDPSPADYEATHAKIRKQQKGQTLEMTKSGKVLPMDVEEVEALEAKKTPAKVSPTKQHICGQCNQQFATAKTLGVHQRSVHNNERTIFPCPMCDTKFLSMWAAVKHLHKYHKKSKAQRERLRKVIKKRSYKKILTLAEEGAVKKAAEDMEKEQEEEEEEAKSTDSDIPNFKTQPDESQNESQEINVIVDIHQQQQQQQQQQPQPDDDDGDDDNGKEDDISNHKEIVKPHHSDRGSPFKGCRSKRGVRWMCNVCSKKFLSRSTCLAHVATHITCNFEPMAVEVPGPVEEQHQDVKASQKLEEESLSHKKKTFVSRKQLKLFNEKKLAAEVPGPVEERQDVKASQKMEEESPSHKKKTVVFRKQFKLSEDQNLVAEVPGPVEEQRQNVKVSQKLEEESPFHKRKAFVAREQFKFSHEKTIERTIGINPKRKIIDSETKLKYKILDSRGNIKNTEFEKHKYKCKNDEQKIMESNNKKEEASFPYEEKNEKINDSNANRPSTSIDSNFQKVKNVTSHDETGLAAQTAILMARKVLAKAKYTAAKASILSRNTLNTQESSKDSSERNIEKGRFIDISKKFTVSSGLKRKHETDNLTGERSKKMESTKYLQSRTNETKTGSTINIDSLVPISMSGLKDSTSMLKDSTSRIKDLHFVEQSTSISGKKCTTLLPVSRSTKISSESKSRKEIDTPESFKGIPSMTKEMYLPQSEASVSGRSLSDSPFHDHKPSHSSTHQRSVVESNFQKELDVKQDNDPGEQMPSSSRVEINALLIKEEDIKEEISEDLEVKEREIFLQENIKCEQFESSGPTCTKNVDIESKDKLQTEHGYIQYKSNKLVKGPIDKVGSSISLLPIDKVGSSINYQSIFRKTKKPVFNTSFEEYTDDDLPLSEKRSREDDDTTLTDSTCETDLESDENFFSKRPKPKDSISPNVTCDNTIESSNLSTFENKMKSKEIFPNVLDRSNKYTNKKSTISNTKVDLELQSQSSSQISIAQNDSNDCNPIRQSLLLSNTLFGKLSYDFQSDFNSCTLSDTNEDFDSNVSDTSTLDSQEDRKSFLKDLTLNETTAEGNSKDQLGDIRYEDGIFGDILPHGKEKKS